MIKLFLTLGFSSFVNAATLHCEILNNLSLVQSTKVKTTPGEKVLIGNLGYLTAYVLEKNQNTFILEAFLPDQEARIYAQGNLNTDQDSVVASFWNRENIFDISCHL